MEIKEIIDQHINQNANYYKGFCFKYYKGRYLWEDLFQETYLAFVGTKPELILKYHNQGKLRILGQLLIHTLFSRRKRVLVNYNGKRLQSHTSPLYESSEIFDGNFDQKVIFDLEDLEGEDLNPIEVRKKSEIKQQNIDRMNFLIKNALKKDSGGDMSVKEPSPYLSVSTFLQVNGSSISEMSRKTKIPRYYLSEIYKHGQQYLKNNLQ